MTSIYVTEPGALLSKAGNKLIISKSKEAPIKDFPIEKIDSIVMINSANISSQLAVELLERDITLTWISNKGKFYGRLEPTRAVNIERQITQFYLADDKEFSFEISKKWIYAKIRNSRVMLSRWARERKIDLNSEIEELKNIADVIKNNQVRDSESLMGYEGRASKIYFDGLKQIVPEEFSFTHRNKQPPKDPFNSLLSFAYTLLMYEIYTAVSLKYLHPYRGFFHKPRRGHPALVSDLMEEWRALLCDSLAVSLLSHKVIKIDDFLDPDEETGGVYLRQEASKNFIEHFEQRIRKLNSYLDFVDYPMSFRESITLQVGSFVKTIESADPEIYRPILIR